MPTLAHFDPATQTLLHSADYFNIVDQHPASLEPVGAAIYVPVLIGIVYLIANVLLGIVILRKRFLPMPIGVLFIVGGLILGAGTSVPIWVEVIGHAAEYLAIAWSAYLIASGSSSNGDNSGYGNDAIRIGPFDIIELSSSGNIAHPSVCERKVHGLDACYRL